MRSFVFNETDFGCLTRAKVAEERSLSVAPRTSVVPGRAGEAILDVAVPPKIVKFLEPMGKMDAAQMVEVRRRLHAALLVSQGAIFQYEDNYVYHDALCTDTDAWDSLYESGSCEVTFTIYDPIAYSRIMRVETGNTFDVNGAWVTYPIIEVVADGSDAITVASADTTTAVTLTGGFAEGAVVVLDYESETVTVDGVAAGQRIALASNFASIRPGTQRFTFEGVSEHSIKFYERWV